MKRTKHIVLAGFNYQIKRSTGDKNFWVELIPCIAKKLDRISILSVRKEEKKYEEYKEGNCLIRIEYLTPRFLETPDAHYERTKIFWREGAFPSWLGVIEKTLNGKRICNELKKLYIEHSYDHIHLMDNFGFINRIIAKNAPTAVSVSAMTYQGKKKLLYENYLRLSYNHPNLKVVPYSSAFARRLTQIGVSESRIVHIPWGVRLPSQVSTVENRKKTKALLSLPVNKPLFLWSGYIQQIQKKDFLFAIDVAKQALEKDLNGTFYFAFKPGSMEKDFISFNDPGKGIFVTTTQAKEFDLLRSAADIFYSPVVNKNCILAPPLTWIEFLSLGVPILTTNARGADEIIIDGKTGYIASSNDELIEKIFIIADTYKEISPYCYEKAFTSYNIKNTANEYLSLWYPRGY